jgi:hypothetical protein
MQEHKDQLFKVLMQVLNGVKSPYSNLLKVHLVERLSSSAKSKVLNLKAFSTISETLLAMVFFRGLRVGCFSGMPWFSNIAAKCVDSACFKGCICPPFRRR